MHDERDAEDVRLLESDEHGKLLAVYYDVIVHRCRLRLPDPRAYDAAHDVVERLLKELRSGKTYRVPYRVVVHKVVDWTIADHHSGRPIGPLPEHWEPVAPDELDESVGRHDLMRLFAGLPERARQVLHLRYLVGLEVPQIADAARDRDERRPPGAPSRPREAEGGPCERLTSSTSSRRATRAASGRTCASTWSAPGMGRTSSPG